MKNKESSKEDLHREMKDLRAKNAELESQCVSLRKQVEVKNNHSLQRYRDLADFFPQIIFEADLEGNLTYVNQCAFSSFGYSQNDFDKGLNIIDAIIPEDHQRVRRGISFVLTGEVSTGNEYTALRKDGSTFPVLIYSAPIISDGCLVGLRGLLMDITNKKTAEETLRENELKYRALVDNSPDIVMRFDRECRHLFASPSVKKSTGIEAENFIGKTHRELGFPEDQCNYWEKKILEVFENGIESHEQFSFNGTGGEVFFDWKLVPEFAADGAVKNVLSISRDITELKQSEKILRVSEDSFRSLFDNSISGVALHEIALNDIGDPIDYIFLMVNSSFEKNTGLKAADIIGKRASQVIPGIEKTNLIKMYGKVALTGESMSFETFFEPLGRYYSINAYQAGKGRFAAVFDDITERKLAEESVKESEERFRAAFMSSSNAIAISSKDGGVFVDVNQMAIEMFGYSRDEVLRKGALTTNLWVDLNDRERIFESINKSGEVRNQEVQLRRKDGSTILALVSVRSLTLKGNKHLLFETKDITEQKRAQEEVAASLKIIEEIINAVPARVFWKDSNLFYLGCNELFAKDAGFINPAEITGKDDYDMSWREQAESYRKDDRQVIESGCPKLLIEELQTTPEGKIIDILTNKIPLRSSNGEIIGVLGIYMDITERKQAEYALKRSEEKFKLISEMSVVGIYIIQGSKIVYVNPSISRIFGYLPEEIIGKLCLKDLIHPDDIPDLLTRFDERFEERLERKIEKNNIVYKAVKKDGSIIHIELFGNLIDYQGKPAVMGTLIDVTERKKAEDELKTSLSITMQREMESHWLLEASNAVLESSTFEESSLRIFKACCEATGAISGYVALLSENGEENDVLFLESGGLAILAP